MKVSILGVSIDCVDRTALPARIDAYCAEARSHTIVTPNPEFLVAAQKDVEFRNVLNKADLAIPDGVGLLVAARLLELPLRTRVTGVEAVEAIAHGAAGRGSTLFLLGGREGVARKAGEALQKKYPALKIVGAESGGDISLETGNWRMSGFAGETIDLIEKIREAKPDILLVALGQVKQELWIRDHLHLFPSVRIAMGVGGTFDYLAGVVFSPPRWMRTIGLEWLWRLITQPWRVRRIYMATIYFLWMIIRKKLGNSAAATTRN